MIKNLWSRVRIFCGNHGDDTSIELIPHDGNAGQDIFYSCPKYYSENREENEDACGNRISIEEYQKMVETLGRIIEDAERHRAMINLTNLEWDAGKGIHYRVLRHSVKHLDVLVVNNRALGRKS